MTFVSLLDQIYWIAGCTIGGVLGSVAAVSIEGVSFAMTALFVVIFLDQWLKDISHASEVIGIASALIALIAFGADRFMIPAMALIIIAVTVIRGRLEPAYRMRGTSGASAQDGDAS